MDEQNRPDLETCLTVKQACEIAAISRSSFYRLLDDPGSGLADIAFRVPGMRCIRISRRRFRQWLKSAPVQLRRKTKENSLDPSAQ